MRGRLVWGSLGALAVIACNAITGAGDLAVCEGPDCPNGSEPAPARDSGAATAAGDGANDADSLPGSCTTGEKRCSGNLAAVCVDGKFQTTPCAEVCAAGECLPFQSCRNPAGSTCGTPQGSCCEPLALPGGTYARNDSASYPATVGAFRLDKYEVTVARFRAFVDAGYGIATKAPLAGAGAHPKIPNSGWLPEWNGELAADTAALKQRLDGGTWTDLPDETSELRPITNVRWFEAFAFCAWDGGRLPTNAEWGFAASGGDEQRYYPWSSPVTSTTIDASYAAYDCAVTKPAYGCTTACSANGASPCDATTCTNLGGTCNTSCYGCSNPADVATVGSYPKGAGRWGHLDLAGNAQEWVLDQTGNFDRGIVLPSPCVDCASLVLADLRGTAPGARDDMFMILRGGAWNTTSASTLRNTRSDYDRYDSRSNARGFRCARD